MEPLFSVFMPFESCVETAKVVAYDPDQFTVDEIDEALDYLSRASNGASHKARRAGDLADRLRAYRDASRPTATPV